MKTHPSSPSLQAAVAALLILGSLPSSAQSAEGFDTSGVAPAEPAPAAKPAEKLELPAAGTDLGPSRYAGEDILSYVQALSLRFSIRQRATDPFGRYQDPDFKAPKPMPLASKSPNKTYTPAAPTAFTDIIAGIKVTMANKQQVIIEGRDRPCKPKDVISLMLPSGKVVKAQVMTVSNTRVDFRNVETGETATLRLLMTPPGMKRTTKDVGPIAVPGLQPTGGDAPIMIDPVTPVSGNP